MPFLHLPSHPDCIPTMFHVKMLFLAAQNISIESSKIIQKPQEKNSLRESTQLPVLFHPLCCYQILVSHSHPCPAPGSLVWKSLCKTCSIRAPDRSSGVPSSPLMLPFPVLLLPFSSGFEHLPGGRAPSTELETSPRLTISDRFRAPKALCVCVESQLILQDALLLLLSGWESPFLSLPVGHCPSQGLHTLTHRTVCARQRMSFLLLLLLPESPDLAPCPQP